MRRCLVRSLTVVAAGICLLLPTVVGAQGSMAAAAAHAAVSTGTWGNAEQVPGTAALNAGGIAEVDSVSCASPGNCSAGGSYADASFGQQAFLVSQVKGIWGNAAEVPGIAALNARFAGVNSVSCASAGNCSAGGFYWNPTFGSQAFVVSQVHGIWGNAAEVPGTAALNRGGEGGVNSVSCPSPGNCSAAGDYTGALGRGQAFVVSQVNDIWGKAKQVPGTAALKAGQSSEAISVSCASAGNCSVGGRYTDASGHYQAYVVSQVKGAWGRAKQVPVTGALNVGGAAQVDSVSCASAGNCSAAGDYWDASLRGQVFVVSQVHGIWGKAKQVAGTAAVNARLTVFVVSVSCASAGNCSAGGGHSDSSTHGQAFVVSQVKGNWGKSQLPPGTAALNAGGYARVNSVSCASPGNCSAGGFYTDASRHRQAFVVSQVNGTWGNATEVPGTAALSAGAGAEVNSVSCASPGNCSAGGDFDVSSHEQAFVVSQT